METEQSSILGNLTWKYVNKNFQIDRVHQWMQFRFVSLLIFFSLLFLLSCAIFRVFFSIRCHSPAIVFRILSFDSFTNSQTKSFTFRQTTIIYFFSNMFNHSMHFYGFLVDVYRSEIQMGAWNNSCLPLQSNGMMARNGMQLIHDDWRFDFGNLAE